MNKPKIIQALTAGLLAGYGGKTKFSTINRGSFRLKSSHFEDADLVYHDEWTNGGGQEIIKVENELFTRVYAGGVTDPKILTSLNISEKDVANNLKKIIAELGDKTRLFSDFKAEKIDGWDYEYKILDSNDQIPVTVGKEIIKYLDQIVFIHIFVLAPIN